MPVFMVTLHHSLYLCVLSVFGMQELALCKNCPLSLFLVQYIYLYTQNKISTVKVKVKVVQSPPRLPSQHHYWEGAVRQEQGAKGWEWWRTRNGQQA